MYRGVPPPDPTGSSLQVPRIWAGLAGEALEAHKKKLLTQAEPNSLRPPMPGPRGQKDMSNAIALAGRRRVLLCFIHTDAEGI